MNAARLRRKTWLKGRRLRGLRRPAPTPLVWINAASASYGKRRVRRILKRTRKLANRVGADVIAGCEAYKADVAKVLGPGWEVEQDWSRGEVTAGTFVAARRRNADVRRTRVGLGVTAYLNGGWADQMRDRYWVRTVVRVGLGTPRRFTLRLKAGHPPPKRNWSPWWPSFMRRFIGGGRTDVYVADWNRLSAAVGPYLDGYNLRLIGIDGFAVAEWIPVSQAEGYNVGSDHKAIVVTLWPGRS